MLKNIDYTQGFVIYKLNRGSSTEEAALLKQSGPFFRGRTTVHLSRPLCKHVIPGVYEVSHHFRVI